MQNFVQPGENLTVAAPYALKSGEGALVGSLFGVAAVDAASGAEVTIVTTGVFKLPKVTTDELAVGEVVHWDDTARLVTGTSTGNTRIGVAVAAASSASGYADVRLNGSF